MVEIISNIQMFGAYTPSEYHFELAGNHFMLCESWFMSIDFVSVTILNGYL